ncbi:alkaline phosphatase D family protein [Actinocorallia populi]|uniref:alkaline phosphatase D family protein n=1 Tax=Actinocorallia populi TaxID=2079200 RepID=UPI000D092348|nr:alkaline phosphatase D family protein [Actinocorallia populi]
MTQLNRREALKLGGAGVAVAALAPAAAHAAPTPYFQHGVASGDPLPQAVVLWTRVTPTPESLPGSGTGPSAEVGWQVAEDADFTAVVASGTLTTGPERDHTVKVDVQGLRPGTGYHYRFSYLDAHSPAGRTSTAPASGADVESLKFGVVSCSDWEVGYFGAYRHLAARDDLTGVIHLGDYIYEYAAAPAVDAKNVRLHQPAHEIITLADYRQRHAQYKTDPDLQALHARYPWMVVWDDHESANNAWEGGAQNHTPDTEGPWEARKAASRQAYDEWMPVRWGQGGVLQRSLRFGKLAELTLLDLRSHRSEQANGLAVDDPARTLTGRAQMDWLKQTLTESRTRWRLLGNSVMVSPLKLGAVTAEVLGPLTRLLGIPQGGLVLNSDQWDGYAADRAELLGHLRENGITNTVFLTGDIHTSWASEVPLKAATYPRSPSVATEFVVPSVASDNIDDMLGVRPRTVSLAAETAIANTNRHVRWTNLDSHGYCVLEVRREQVRMDWYFLADRKKADTSARKAVSFTGVSGTQKIKRVWG